MLPLDSANPGGATPTCNSIVLKPNSIYCRATTSLRTADVFSVVLFFGGTTANMSAVGDWDKARKMAKITLTIFQEVLDLEYPTIFPKKLTR